MENKDWKYQPKPLFDERIKKLLRDEKDYEAYMKIVREKPANFIRCNTLKISPDQLMERLEDWEVKQPFPDHREIMLVGKILEPGELGKRTEHLMGLFYVQEISSMMSVLALNPKEGELVLDLCASPGSKTTQIAAMMNNTGTIICNDKDMGRISILSANLERCGASNAIITRHDAVQLCEKLKGVGLKFDKILLDVPCSGEGTIRSSPKTFLMWNEDMIEKLGRLQRKMIASAIPLLKEEGELVYSTCTHAPEENEKNVDFIVKNFGLEVEKIHLPLKCRPGIREWKGEEFVEEVERACRIYPQDNDSEGFFVCKFRKKES